MTDYTDLISLVKSKTGYATPVSGGDDPISDDEIIIYLNNAFSHMTKKIGGIEKYVQFTITAAGVITVTVPASSAPTVSLVSPALFSFPSYKISDAHKILKIENLTADVADTVDRLIYPVPQNLRQYASYFEGEDEYYLIADSYAKRGIVLLPKTITVTNTLGVTYGSKFTKFSVSDVSEIVVGGSLALSRNAASNFTGSDGVTKTYRVQLDAGDPATPNTFRWGSVVGNTWPFVPTWTEQHVPITGTAHTLDNGFTITFDNTTGGVGNDTWQWTVTAPGLDDNFEDEEMYEYPTEYAAAMTAKDLQQREWIDMYGYAKTLLATFLRNREDAAYGGYYSIED